MSSLAITQSLSSQQMSDLLEADRKEDYSGFFDRVLECAEAGIQLTTVEVFLREHHCKTYLVACEHKKSILWFYPCRSPDGTEKPYHLYVAMHPEARKEAHQKVKNEDENLQNLANTGFV